VAIFQYIPLTSALPSKHVDDVYHNCLDCGQPEGAHLPAAFDNAAFSWIPKEIQAILIAHNVIFQVATYPFDSSCDRWTAPLYLPSPTPGNPRRISTAETRMTYWLLSPTSLPLSARGFALDPPLALVNIGELLATLNSGEHNPLWIDAVLARAEFLTGKLCAKPAKLSTRLRDQYAANPTYVRGRSISSLNASLYTMPVFVYGPHWNPLPETYTGFTKELHEFRAATPQPAEHPSAV
jgi:hypothetical protein